MTCVNLGDPGTWAILGLMMFLGQLTAQLIVLALRRLGRWS